MRAAAISVLAWLGLASASFGQCAVPSYNEFFGVPKGYVDSQAFVGKFDYSPQTTEAPPPFLAIDFTTDWQAYIWSVLDYAYEGNMTGAGTVEADFDISANTTRSWYHMIWMHPGPSGREFVHGLTKERGTDPEQLKDGVTRRFQTWAIGYYNAFGAQTLSKVFADPCQPDATNVLFPVGTVSFKLLFTTASKAEVPYLDGSPEWKVDVDRANEPAGEEPKPPRVMRLLQVDVAVRDPRATDTGWVFGTFVYNNAVADPNPWRRLRAVGLSWGNDPTVAPGGTLVENVVDASLSGTTHGWAERPELGWGGRMNGPADNLISSCTSCHGTAQFPRSDDFGNLPSGPVDANDVVAVAQRLTTYFRNIAPGQLFDPQTKFFQSTVLVDALSMDYSLQLQAALERFCFSAEQQDPPLTGTTVPLVCDETARIASPLSVAPADEDLKRILLEGIDWDNYMVPVR